MMVRFQYISLQISALGYFDKPLKLLLLYSDKQQECDIPPYSSSALTPSGHPASRSGPHLSGLRVNSSETAAGVSGSSNSQPKMASVVIEAASAAAATATTTAATTSTLPTKMGVITETGIGSQQPAPIPLAVHTYPDQGQPVPEYGVETSSPENQTKLQEVTPRI